ncbi:MAG: hypothetical protein ACFFED_10380 [Candidatus Thorarchaeota archaeon]
MTTRTEYFEDPIIRIGIEEARFPRMCPICGCPANRLAKVSASPNGVQNPRYRTSAKARLLGPGVKTLHVYVCDEHYQTDEGRERSKFICALSNGIIVSILLIGIMSTGGDLWYGRPINPLFYVTVVLFLLGLILSIPTFGAGPLESSVKIIGFDAGFRNIWLQLKNKHFRDQFIQENAMKAELVRWIKKI